MNNNSRTSSLGPFFNFDSESSSAPAPTSPEITQIGSIEWASPAQAHNITLFRHRPAHAPNRLRIENIVLREADVPFDLSCSESSVVQSGGATYIPLEALLVALYERGLVSRPILTVLRDLAEKLPLYSRVQHPVLEPGMLAEATEREGFQLMSVDYYEDLQQIFATVGWRPHPGADALHACTLTFRRSPAGEIDDGGWAEPGSISIAQVLGPELRRLSPGKAIELLTPAGRRRLALKR
jgi:hypothetical protein